jgi:predicted nucleic acid-binding protein
MILVDTSVWIDHFRQNGVQIHPMVIGELACGDLKHKKQILNMPCGLPQSK